MQGVLRCGADRTLALFQWAAWPALGVLKGPEELVFGEAAVTEAGGARRRHGGGGGGGGGGRERMEFMCMAAFLVGFLMRSGRLSAYM